MKYYLYISDQKVDMLLPQVPLKVKQRISTELSVELGVLSAGLKAERETLDNKVARLNAVDRYIRSTDTVGDLRDPNYWISDALFLRFASFQERKGLTFFVGSTGEVDLVLGGSAGHLIANNPREEVAIGWSYLPFLLETLESVLKAGRDLALDARRLDDELNEAVGPPGNKPWYNVIEVIQTAVHGPETRVEFLAKTLAVGPPSKSTGRRPILASPIYVAMAE